MDIDVFDEIEQYSLIEPNNNENNQDIIFIPINENPRLTQNNDKKENEILRETLFISPINETKLYTCPSEKSTDARYIWLSATIPIQDNIRNIERFLFDWACKNAELDIDNENHKIKFIYWKSKNGSKCQSTWRCFLRWILCASVS